MSTISGDSEISKAKGRVPIIATPLSEYAESYRRATVILPSREHKVYYAKREEASMAELFYDLFFVANLVYFTAAFKHADADFKPTAIWNYIKLFTLMWFIWLSTTLFDVRFGTDSVLNRIFKACHFGIMTGYVTSGPIFDGYDKKGDTQAYRNFVLVLSLSSFVLAFQYSVVGFQSWHRNQTRLPLGLTVGVNLACGICFLIAMGSVGEDSSLIPTMHWVLIFFVAIENGLTMAIASLWPVISFKHSNLVERVHLLTIIVLGEGIIGLIKSASCITKAVAFLNGAEIGSLVAGVFLIYSICMLYFDQIEEGTLITDHQEVWALLHFPLHVAILLCVEGSSALIVWDSTVQGIKWIISMKPLDMSRPAAAFDSLMSFTSYLNDSMWAINDYYKTEVFLEKYDFVADIDLIINVTDTAQFQSPEWNNLTSPIVEKMFDAAQYFVFEAHKGVLDKLLSVIPSIREPGAFQASFGVFRTVMTYFFVGAGVMLLLLAMMHWFGKVYKIEGQHVVAINRAQSIGRVIVGFAMIVFGITAVMPEQTENGIKIPVEWIIPTVVFGIWIIITADNVLLAFGSVISERLSSSENQQPPANGGFDFGNNGDRDDAASTCSAKTA